MEYKGVWTIAEAYEGDLKAVSFELLSRGRKLADELNEELVSVLIGGKVKEERVNELIKRGADRVIIVEDQLLDRFIVETYSNVLIDLIKSKKPEIVLSAATVNGRTLMPHVAMKIHAGLTADCTELGIEEKTGNLLQTRPAIGGNILATIKSPDSRPQMATVRPKSSRPLEIDETRTGVIERVAFQKNLFDSRVKHLETIIGGEDDVNIQESDIVVSGGKGMKKSDNFKMLYDLIYKKINIPIVFDFHHYLYGPKDQSMEESLKLALSTWKTKPMTHMSSSKLLEQQNVRTTAHADYIYEKIPFLNKYEFDCEIEAKMKDKAVLSYIKDYIN